MHITGSVSGDITASQRTVAGKQTCGRSEQPGLSTIAWLVLASIFVLFRVPNAFAACDITSNSVSCAANTTTADTTNIDGATPSSSDRYQSFTAGGNLIGNIAGGITIDGTGLAIGTTQNSSTISFTNSGIINQTIAASAGTDAALSLQTNTGAINYSGNGTITTSLAGSALMFSSGNGAAGDISATVNGAITDSKSAGSGVVFSTAGVSSISLSGSGTISSSSNTGGSAISATQSNATPATVGNITIGGSGDTLFGGTAGITVVHGANAGAVLINRSGAITGTGTFSRGQTGISVTDNGTVGTTISGTGPINAGSYGIVTTGSANVSITPGNTITSDLYGIQAMQSGSASVTVNSTHDISSDLPIWIASDSGPTKVVVSGGTISGLQAITTGTSGAQSVTMTGGTLLSTTNGAINTFSAGNGSTTINQSGGTIGTSAAPVNAGIVAESSGGPVNITAGTIIGDEGIGVNKTNAGAPGAVTITTNGPITTVPQGGHAAATAIYISGPTGPTSITNNSAIISGYNGTAYGTLGVVQVVSTNGAIAITNNASGSITSSVSNAETLPVIITSGGASTLVNAGSLTGTISLADAPNSFSNSGIWNSSGVNSFGSGASSFINSGTLNAGSHGPASFTTTGTLSFVNNGTFNLLGPTTIGAVAASGAGQTLTIANGSVLTGSGTIAGNMVVANGATYSPGSSTPGTFMTQTGSLTLLTGSAYGVVLNNNMSTFAKVSGTVTVAGTVNATFLPDSYAQKSFTILTSSGLTGTFSSLSTSNLPANFAPSLTYDSNNAYLTLKAALTPPASTTTTQTTAGTSTNPTAQSGTAAPATNGATTGGTSAGVPPSPINQQNVANALNGYFNSGGNLPPAFLTVYGLGGAGLSSALNQLSGEPGAAVANAGSQSLAPFMDALFDRLTDIDSGNEIQPAQLSSVSGVRTWASAFGGHEHAQGDTSAGSHASHSDVLGLAAGVDTELVPGWSLGASLAAGRLHFGVAQGLGRGESDVIELGGYAYRDLGDRTYLIGALAYAWHDMATQRLLSIGGSNTQLNASFNAQNYGLRLEGGKHLPLDGVLTITPYAGLQWDEFDTPAYQESAPSGFASYALGYLAHGSPRSDTVLGARLSNGTDDNNDMLTWDGHLAWQHNLETKEASHAAFLALPGTEFSVNGSSLDSNVALVGAGLTLNPQGQISFGAKIDTSIGPHTQTIFGSLTFSHDW